MRTENGTAKFANFFRSLKCSGKTRMPLVSHGAHFSLPSHWSGTYLIVPSGAGFIPGKKPTGTFDADDIFRGDDGLGENPL